LRLYPEKRMILYNRTSGYGKQTGKDRSNLDEKGKTFAGLVGPVRSGCPSVASYRFRTGSIFAGRVTRQTDRFKRNRSE
jgi:hypothetical protein